MIDFNTIKSIQIPEGNVTQITCNDNVIWPTKETWDVEWVYNGSMLPSTEWNYPIGGGGYKLSGNQNAVQLYTYNPDAVDSYSQGLYTILRHKNYLSQMSRKAVLEVEVLCRKLYKPSWGTRITLGAGIDGVAQGKALQVTLNITYNPNASYCLSVLEGSTSITSTPNTCSVELETWYKIRLELDMINNNNKVFLDDVLIATVDNANLSTASYSNYWEVGQQGIGFVRAIRYRNKDV